jgi:hypothetical protein
MTYTPNFKPRNRIPLWLEMTLLTGLAVMFGVTYWQYRDAKQSFDTHEEVKQLSPQ